MIKFSLLFIVLALSISCTRNTKHQKQAAKEEKKLSINDSLKFPQLYMKFYLINDNLYRDSAFNIYFKTIDRSFVIDSLPIFPRYIDIVYSDKFEPDGIKNMTDVIDTSTFHEISGIYYKDKRYVYVFNEMMDGGTFAIVDEADLKSFRVLKKSQYATDINHCYYKGSLIEGSDRKSFKLVNSNIPYYYFYAFDKKHFYDCGSRMEEKELKELGFDTLKGN